MDNEKGVIPETTLGILVKAFKLSLEETLEVSLYEIPNEIPGEILKDYLGGIFEELANDGILEKSWNSPGGIPERIASINKNTNVWTNLSRNSWCNFWRNFGRKPWENSERVFSG